MASTDPQRPNVLFILSDDQGPWDMGCAGNGDVHTPSLDALAAAGTRFSHFFCTSPVCSPARASLLTGQMPSQHGIHDWIQRGNAEVEYLAGHTSYTELLAAAGYTCGLSGKWHLGASQAPQQGFSHWYVHQGGASSYTRAPMYRNGELVHEDGYVTDLITEDALRFIGASRGDDRPFYSSVHYTAPHYPWIGEHLQQDLDLYRDNDFPSCPQEPEHPWSRPTPLGDEGRARRREALQGYFASLTAMDRGIGRLLTALDDSGLRESTVVWFLSDNGFNTGHHGIWGKGNGTFPQNMYDSSVMVPAIVSQPGRVPRGRVEDALVSGYDVFPTMLELAGLDVPDELVDWLPGRSLLPLILGEEDATGEFVVVHDEYGPVRMLRTREWKYVHRYPYGPHELYHLAEDPGETTNLVGEDGTQDLLAEMRHQLELWFARYTDVALDGARQPVTGRGQIAPIGPAGGGRLAFQEAKFESESLEQLLGPG